MPLCAPGLLPLLRAGARLRSRSRRIAEVVVVVVDRGVVVQGLGGRARASGEVAVVQSCAARPSEEGHVSNAQSITKRNVNAIPA